MKIQSELGEYDSAADIPTISRMVRLLENKIKLAEQMPKEDFLTTIKRLRDELDEWRNQLMDGMANDYMNQEDL